MRFSAESLYKDREFGDIRERPATCGIMVKGKQGNIFCTYFKAGGPGLHPALLLVHGFPGHEKNMDIAYSLRRVGISVMIFFYSGSWGSDGNYSFAGCLDDAHTVLDYMCSTPELDIDTSNIFIAGHSLGGFVTGHMLAARDEFKGGVLIAPADLGRSAVIAADDERVKASLYALMQEGAPWLKGTDADTLLKELMDKGGEYMLPAVADKLAEKDMLVIGGALDTVVPVEENVTPLLDAVRASGGSKARYTEFNSDHSMTDVRIGLTEAVAEFLFGLM